MLPYFLRRYKSIAARRAAAAFPAVYCCRRCSCCRCCCRFNHAPPVLFGNAAIFPDLIPILPAKNPGKKSRPFFREDPGIFMAMIQ